METPRDTTELALRAADLGMVPIPLHPGTKVPRVSWKRWQSEIPPADLIRAWFTVRSNIAVICTGRVIFDCEDMDIAQLVLRECGDTPHKLKTPRGVHLGYRRRKGVEVQNRVKVKGKPIDIRTDGGLEVIAPSETADGRYEWLGPGLIPTADLPVARIGWTRERVKSVARGAVYRPGDLPEGKGRIRFPEQYCLKIPSIQGQNGSRGLVRCVAVMRDAGRTPQQIFDFIKAVWGPACCEPEWSEKEIWYCIRRHCR